MSESSQGEHVDFKRKKLKIKTCSRRPLPLKGRKDNEKGHQSMKENKEERKEEEEMRVEFWKLRVFRSWWLTTMTMQK